MDSEDRKRLDEIEKSIEKLYDEQSRKLYDYIVEMGDEAFNEGKPLYKFRNTDLFEKLIAHFESTEEYEKCAFILKQSTKIRDSIVNKL
jgi:DnaJ-class molecular chaperone